MMKKNVSVEVMPLAEFFDVLLPGDMQIGSLIPLICRSIKELSDNRYVISGSELLAWREKNLLLRMDTTLDSYGIENGDHLMLY